MGYRIKRNMTISAGLVLALVLGTGPSAAESTGYVYTTDYSSGQLLSMSPDGSQTETRLVLHGDARLREFHGYLYIVERFGADNIIKADPNDFDNLQQLSTGNGSNPADIAFASDTKAYVTRTNSASLWIIDPSTMTKSGEIDLSSLADADGIPDMAEAAVFGNHLFVVCQRLTNYNPVSTSIVVVIDTDVDTLVDTDPEEAGVQPIELILKNPYDTSTRGDGLYLACAGEWNNFTDGGVEVINMATLRDAGVILEGTDLGGDVASVTAATVDRGYVTVNEGWDGPVLSSSVYQFSPLTREIGSQLEGLTSPSRVVAHGEYVYVLDGNETAPGVFIYHPDDTSPIAGPINVGLPPADLVFIDDTSGIDHAEIPAKLPERLSLGPVYPNPANSGATIPYSLAEAGEVRLAIYNSAGRLVRGLVRGYQPSGSHRVHWDGSDDRGRAAASGVYFVHFSNLDREVEVRRTKFTLLK